MSMLPARRRRRRRDQGYSFPNHAMRTHVRNRSGPPRRERALSRARTLARLPTQLAHAAGVPRPEFSIPCHPAEPRIRTALLTPATAG